VHPHLPLPGKSNCQSGGCKDGQSELVEVEFNTDPNEYEFRRAVMDAIEETARGVLGEETTMAMSHLKVVPRLT
jgi:hypothetical protein